MFVVGWKIQFSPAPSKIVAVGEQRVVAGREHDEAADQEGEDDRQHRHDDAAGALAEREPGGERSGLRCLLGRSTRSPFWSRFGSLMPGLLA